MCRVPSLPGAVLPLVTSQCQKLFHQALSLQVKTVSHMADAVDIFWKCEIMSLNVYTYDISKTGLQMVTGWHAQQYFMGVSIEFDPSEYIGSRI